MKELITTDADLDNCIFFQSTVEVWFQGELDDSGILQDFTDTSVKVNGYYYLRDNCTLKK